MPLRTLYVNRQGAMLGIRKDALIVRAQKAIIDVVPMASLQSVVLLGHVQVSTQAVDKLLNMGIDLIYLSQKGKWRGRLVGSRPRNIFLMMAQFEATKNSAYRHVWAQNLLFAKVLAERLASSWLNDARDVWEWESIMRLNQAGAVVVQSFENGYEQPLYDLLPLDRQIVEGIRDSFAHANTMNESMGIEGKEAQRYFSQWDRWLQPCGFEFVQRSRRPAKNAVNAILNLGYMMMLSEVERALLINGFEPMLGLLHGVSYGRNSLALDILELFRTFPIEMLVLKLLLSQSLVHEHFETHSSGEVRLVDEGWEIWLRAYEGELHAYREYIQKVMAILRAQLLTSQNGRL